MTDGKAWASVRTQRATTREGRSPCLSLSVAAQEHPRGGELDGRCELVLVVAALLDQRENRRPRGRVPKSEAAQKRAHGHAAVNPLDHVCPCDGRQLGLALRETVGDLACAPRTV
jgi:hypothetical protein